jgi:hypothetical protein
MSHITRINYYEPKNKDMAIILAYFNFCNSKNILNNLLTVKKSFEKANIPFYIGEVIFNDQKSVFNDGEENVFTFITDSYMFYKENIINIIEEKIPENYTKICVMDADILFNDKNWYSTISLSLNKNIICQPFNNAIWLDKRYREIQRNQSVLTKNNGGHPGFIWAFDRKWLKKNKLFDLSIIGGGDILFASALLKIEFNKKRWLNLSYNNYISHLNLSNSMQISNCDLTVYHLYHGQLKNRQYTTRNYIINDLLSFFGVDDIIHLLKRNDDGLLQWKDEYKQKCNENIKTFFINRFDDT